MYVLISFYGILMCKTQLLRLDGKNNSHTKIYYVCSCVVEISYLLEGMEISEISPPPSDPHFHFSLATLLIWHPCNWRYL